MSWTLLLVLILGLSAALSLVALRRHDLRRQERGVQELATARARGTRTPRLQFPDVDLKRCIGCGKCVRACPEEGVLDIVHGQALVIHGARCVGHGLCAKECPAGAIAVTLGDLSARDDLPILDDRLECISRRGVFLAGEITGYALIRTAIGHGVAVANEVARRKTGECSSGTLDLVIIGAGPAGLACALEAKRLGLKFELVDQEGLGGTVAKYPRRKLVMTQPVELPLVGKLSRKTYSKEELIQLWTEIVETQELPLREGVAFHGVRESGGSLIVELNSGPVATHNVCLAIGRRGTPRRLGVPGEDLQKVAYSLQDAAGYRDRQVLVVGGGDSAVEAAIGLAEQVGNEVVLSYRRAALTRIKARNEERLATAVAGGQLRLMLESQVERITDSQVDLRVGPDGSCEQLENDDVFLMLGGVPPYELLRSSGVEFDPSLRPEAAESTARRGLLKSLTLALLFALAALAWVLGNREYYFADWTQRAVSGQHNVLWPRQGFGLACGVIATALLVINLAYLLRRSSWFPIAWGSLQNWMTAHVVTGVTCLVAALLHGGMTPRDTVGGHALWGLTVLVITGAIGRYLYAFVPRAANGRELDLEEVQAQLASVTQGWDRLHRGFADQARSEVQVLVDSHRWEGGLFRRVLRLIRSRGELRRWLARLEQSARKAELPEEQVRSVTGLAQEAYRAARSAAHHEELRALLGSWRYLHRWIAVGVVLLVGIHVVTAIRFANLRWS